MSVKMAKTSVFGEKLQHSIPSATEPLKPKLHIERLKALVIVLRQLVKKKEILNATITSQG